MDCEYAQVFGRKYRKITVDDVDYIDDLVLTKQFRLIKEGKRFINFKSKLYQQQYDPIGDYLNFSKLSVKDWKVVDIDGSGIPINTYNDEQHHYPITIAHYGLELYGKLLNQRKSYIIYMGDVEKKNIVVSESNGEKKVSIKSDLNIGYEITETKGVRIQDIRILSGASFRLHLCAFSDNKCLKICIYDGKTTYISGTQYYNLGDFAKIPNYKLVDNIRIRGAVDVDALIIKNNDLQSDMEKVAIWFLENQSSNGGWLSNFDHNFYKGRTEILRSGWCSALAQGLIISFLTRVASLSEVNRDVYLDACERGLEPFYMESAKGGVLTHWGGEPFYEEYPTAPASFVLNGFIFSLLGLYDYQQVGSERAALLFQAGVSTLNKLLPLYDLGDKSAYDLTHYTCKSYPNVARWGYHATHVNQLYAIYSITNSKLHLDFFERWRSYLIDGFGCPTN
ncbi:D-glucuronyl C5-epimerase family protein [Pseudomonadales bacterium]|nr:D-glucuronyl C5-epimerase family protein [Pseudomonadales bacterium]